jgi:hypothetical protein
MSQIEKASHPTLQPALKHSKYAWKSQAFSCWFFMYSDSSRAQVTPRCALTQGILSVNLGHHPQSRKGKFICLLPSTRNPMFYSDFVLLSSNHVTPRVSRKRSRNRHTEQDAVEGHRPKRRGVSSEVLYESNTSMQESGRFLRTRKTAAMFDNASSTGTSCEPDLIWVVCLPEDWQSWTADSYQSEGCGGIQAYCEQVNFGNGIRGICWNCRWLATLSLSTGVQPCGH